MTQRDWFRCQRSFRVVMRDDIQNCLLQAKNLEMGGILNQEVVVTRVSQQSVTRMSQRKSNYSSPAVLNTSEPMLCFAMSR
jgi:hypothetical protein